MDELPLDLIRSGERVFATLHYCAPCPEEAVAIGVKDMTLPAPGAEDQWSELMTHTATPEVGKHWTDTGVGESPGLRRVR